MDNYKIMMAHRVDIVIIGNALKVRDIDLALNGYTYSGQVKIHFKKELFVAY